MESESPSDHIPLKHHHYLLSVLFFLLEINIYNHNGAILSFSLSNIFWKTFNIPLHRSLSLLHYFQYFVIIKIFLKVIHSLLKNNTNQFIFLFLHPFPLSKPAQAQFILIPLALYFGNYLHVSKKYVFSSIC